MHETRNRAPALLAVLAVAACSGSDGSPGGPGDPGTSTGTVAGTLTYQPAGTSLPATNVDVTTVPAVTDSSGAPVTAVSGADGAYSLSLPVGVYTVQFAGNSFSTVQVAGVSVLAGKTTTVTKTLTATNPLVVTASSAIPDPAGFGSTVTLGVNVSGGTPPYTYAWAPGAENPTAATLSSTSAAAPTVTTAALEDVVAALPDLEAVKAYRFCPGGPTTCTIPGVGFGPVADAAGNPLRDSQFLAIGADALVKMTYAFTCTVTDAQGFTRAVTVSVVPGTLAQANSIVPLKAMVAMYFKTAPGAAFTRPSGSRATLDDADTSYPWFIPDVAGNYTIGTGAAQLVLNASDFTGSDPGCGVCHGTLPVEERENVAARFRGWANSAHGNHFFEFMEYDSSGALVWKKDARGNPLPAPTANPDVFWSQPGAMTTFQLGMTGAEGTHYSASCVGCHTTGYDLATNNGGADDVMRQAGWSFPDLTRIFTSLPGPTSAQVVSNGVVNTVSYDQVTAAPVNTAWDATPAAVKHLAGVQCESCHGPLGDHESGGASAFWDSALTSYVKPVGVYDVAACAVCHDRPADHDRVNLWRESARLKNGELHGHASFETAIHEGVGTGAVPSASCNRCHTAQGFVQWLDQQQGVNRYTAASPGPLGKPDGTAADAAFMAGLGITRASAMPITCAACHDAHTTKVRVKDGTGLLPAGFSVDGAGTGALCMMCHNSRNGARGDGLTALDDYSGTAPTAIGAPHQAAQTDVYLGKNAYWFGGTGVVEPSGHLSVGDTCVGCHMKLFPDGKSGAGTNHTWVIDTTVCKACHGGALDGEAMQARFDAAAADLLEALNDAAVAALPATFTVKGTGASAQAVTIRKSDIQSAVLVTGRSPGLYVEFKTGVTYENPDDSAQPAVCKLGSSATSGYGLVNFYTDAGATTKVFDLLDGNIAKANWNYTLVTADGSRGVHNPGFVSQLIASTRSALAGTLATP